MIRKGLLLIRSAIRMRQRSAGFRLLFTLFALCSAGVFCGGCGSDDTRMFTEPEPTPQPTPEPPSAGSGDQVRFSLSSVYGRAIGALTRADAAADGTSATTPLPTSTKIGFYAKIPVAVSTRSGVTYKEQGNVPGEYSNSSKKWEPKDEDIWLNSQDATIAVYAPYDVNQPKNALCLNLKADLLKSDAGDNDIVAGTTTANNETVLSGVTATLSHVYTCLQFSFVKDNNYPQDVKINKIEMSGNDIAGEAQYDPITGEYTKTGNEVSIILTDEITVPTKSDVETNSSTPAIVRLLLIPINETFNADAYLWVNTTDGKRMKVKIPQGTFTKDSRPFSPGKQYNFNVKLSPVEMDITDITTADWETASAIEADAQF